MFFNAGMRETGHCAWLPSSFTSRVLKLLWFDLLNEILPSLLGEIRQISEDHMITNDQPSAQYRLLNIVGVQSYLQSMPQHFLILSHLTPSPKTTGSHRVLDETFIFSNLHTCTRVFGVLRYEKIWRRSAGFFSTSLTGTDSKLCCILRFNQNLMELDTTFFYWNYLMCLRKAIKIRRKKLF